MNEVEVASVRASKTKMLIKLVVAVGVIAAVVVGGMALLGDKANDEPSSAGTAKAVVSESKPELVDPDKGLTFIRGYKDIRGAKRFNYRKADEWEAAAKHFAQAREQAGAPIRWTSAEQLSRGWVALLRNKPGKAVRLMKKAVASEGDWAAAQLGLANALMEKRKWKRAMRHAKRAQKLAPGWWLPTATIGQIQQDRGRLKAALKTYKRAMAKEPLEAHIPSAISLVHHAMGRNELALKFAKKAISLDGRVVGANITFAERALLKEKARKALMHADVALSVGPNNGVAMLARADALQALQRPKLATAAFTSAVELIDKRKQIGAPAARLAAVRDALSKDKLPEARFKVKLEPKPKDKKGEKTKKRGLR